MFQIFWLNVKACTLLLLGIGFPIFSASSEVVLTLKEHRPGMQIRKLLTLIVIAWLLPAALSAQTLSVQFKVRETRLFGLSGERFAKLELSNQNRITPLTSENVNGGQFYYFVFRPAGDWKVDADFVKEEIPRLVLRQNEKTYPIASAGEIMSDTTSTFVFLGFPKELKLYLPFSSQFRLPDSTIEVGFVIPEEYWPGYSLLTEALKSTERAIEEKRYHDAIRLRAGSPDRSIPDLSSSDSVSRPPYPYVREFSQSGHLHTRRSNLFGQKTVEREDWPAR